LFTSRWWFQAIFSPPSFPPSPFFFLLFPLSPRNFLFRTPLSKHGARKPDSAAFFFLYTAPVPFSTVFLALEGDVSELFVFLFLREKWRDPPTENLTSKCHRYSSSVRCGVRFFLPKQSVMVADLLFFLGFSPLRVAPVSIYTWVFSPPPPSFSFSRFNSRHWKPIVLVLSFSDSRTFPPWSSRFFPESRPHSRLAFFSIFSVVSSLVPYLSPPP